MGKLIKSPQNNSLKPKPTEFTEFSIYKHFPFLDLIKLILAWPVLVFSIFIADACSPIKSRRKPIPPIKAIIIMGLICGLIFHLPSYLSALLMHYLQKPILTFNAQGFYYTPQLWSKDKLYRWEAIQHIEIFNYYEDNRINIKIFLSNQECIVIKDTIIPISYTELLSLFRYRLPTISIKERYMRKRRRTRIKI